MGTETVSKTLALLGMVALVLVPAAAANHVSPSEVIKVLERDVIPAIYAPTFTTDPALDPSEEVIGVVVNGEARAYPLRILNWHEAVNDVVGGEPLLISYCPLCGTGIVYEREVGGETLVFGVSGQLYRSNLVLVDNQTGSLWSQIGGDAILGPLHGTILAWRESAFLPWGDWRALHPASAVLLPPLPECAGGATGDPCRDYTVDPYAGYRQSTVVYSEFGGEYVDTALHPKVPVLGVAVGAVAMAYPLHLLSETPVVHDRLNRQEVLVAWANGSAAAFDPGERRFQPDEGVWMVDQEGVRWHRLTGESERGGTLEALEATRSLWFAWASFFPGTGIHTVRPPSVLALRVTSDPVEVAQGTLLRHRVVLENTGNVSLAAVRVSLLLAPVLEYVDDTAASLPSFVNRSVVGTNATFRFDELGPGNASFGVTARVQEGFLPGVVFRSTLSVAYEDPDGRTIRATQEGETFRIREGGPPIPPGVLLLAGTVAAGSAALFLGVWLLGRGRLRND